MIPAACATLPRGEWAIWNVPCTNASAAPVPKDSHQLLGITMALPRQKPSLQSAEFIEPMQCLPVAKLPEGPLPDTTIVDDEIVTLDATGRPSFSVLQNYNHAFTPLQFYIFDLLHLRGENLHERPLNERRALFRDVVMPELSSSETRFSESLAAASITEIIAAAEQLGLEGIIAKRRDSYYEPGNAWAPG